MLYVQGGRRDITGEKGKSTEEVSPSTGKAHHHGGAVPSVSIPGVGTLSRMWARGVSVAAHVQGRALTPIPGLLSCSTSSAPPCTHPHPNYSFSKQKGGGRSVCSIAA